MLYVMMLPALVYLLINNYLPMIGLSLAFRKIDFQKGIFGGAWAGFENFRYLFATSDSWVITRNTLLYNLAFLVFITSLAVIVALLFNEIKSSFAKKFYQCSILLPYMISIIIVSYLVKAFLDTQTGIVNKSVLPFFGAKTIQWYSTPKYWPFILVFTQCWKTVGYYSVIYLAAIVAISPDLYEAAEIESATKLQQIRYITLPMIKPVILMFTMIAIGKIFYSDFGLFYHVPMNSGLLYPVTNVIDTYVYRGLMELSDFNMAAAAGFYQSLVGFVLVISTNAIMRKVSPESSMF
jgi:putative aldouronate transport system permease protein